MTENPFSKKRNPWSHSYPYQFESCLERFGVGKKKVIWYHVLFLDKSLRTKLPFDKYPRLRVVGTIANVPIENAFIPTGDGRNYVIVSPQVINEANISLGESVEMCFRIADQNKVDVPEVLLGEIELDTETHQKWEVLSPGKKRMLCHHVMSAKTEKTQIKRVGEALEALIDFDADLRLWRSVRKISRKA